VELSPDTIAVLDYLNDAVEGGLRKKNDVGTLLELGATHDEHELFNTLTRTGKGLWNVYGTLRRASLGSEGYAVLEREFGTLLNDLREQMALLVNHLDDEHLKRFDDVYFGMTQGVVRNVVDIAHDLAKVKDLQNERR